MGEAIQIHGNHFFVTFQITELTSDLSIQLMVKMYADYQLTLYNRILHFISVNYLFGLNSLQTQKLIKTGQYCHC